MQDSAAKEQKSARKVTFGVVCEINFRYTSDRQKPSGLPRFARNDDKNFQPKTDKKLTVGHIFPDFWANFSKRSKTDLPK